MNFFPNNNKHSLQIVNKYKNVIYSYLEAVPDSGTKKYNHITTIPMSERNEQNGMANFKFGYNEFLNDAQHLYTECNVRVENGAFNNVFSIKASKVNSIKKADLIVFACESNPQMLYIADRKHNNDNDWLTDKSLRKVVTTTFDGIKEVTFYQYDIENLWRLGHIIEIFQDDAMKYQNVIAILHNDYNTKTGEPVRTAKRYIDYNIDTDHIKFVQYDAKSACTYYFGYNSYTCTSIPGTLPGMTHWLSNYSDATPESIYQKLYKVLQNNIKDGKAHSCKVKLDRKDCHIDPSIINENNEIEIFVSTSETFNIKDNLTTNTTSDMKAYKKVLMYLKRHENKYNPKWTEEEKAIADGYLAKKQK